VFTNLTDKYKRSLEKRGLKKIDQYAIAKLTHPTAKQISSLNMIGHTWRVGDRFYKLAHEHYGDSTLWWVIAWFNQTPTESNVSLGEVIQIPKPLDRIMELLDI